MLMTARSSAQSVAQRLSHNLPAVLTLASNQNAPTALLRIPTARY